MTKTLTLVAALLATSAVATPRLLDDAPRQFVGASLLTATEATVSTSAAELSFGEHFGKTSAVGVTSVFGASALGAAIGGLGISLFGGPIITLLVNLFLPPLLTTLVAQWLGNADAPGRFGFWLPVAAAFVVNAAAFVLSAFVFGVAWSNPAGILAYSLIDGVLMSAGSVGLMHLTKSRPAATVTSFVPGVSDTTLVPLVKVAL